MPTDAAQGRWLRVVRWSAAAVFIVFGAAKFANHASELASFRLYGLPEPDLFVYAVGALELVGGVLLAARRLLVPVALALAGDMVGAIVVSGLAHGEAISLTLAPVLLVAMLALARLGAAPARPCSPPDQTADHESELSTSAAA